MVSLYIKPYVKAAINVTLPLLRDPSVLREAGASYSGQWQAV